MFGYMVTIAHGRVFDCRYHTLDRLRMANINDNSRFIDYKRRRKPYKPQIRR